MDQAGLLAGMDKWKSEQSAGGQPPGASPLEKPKAGGAWTDDRLLDLMATGKFQRSLDGDTVEMSSPTSKSKLAISYRLAGIDAPESAQGDVGKFSHEALDKLVADNGGEVKEGSRQQDMHGRRVSILYAGGKNLNLEMVRGGHAKVYEQYLGTLSKPMQQALLDAQAQAKEKGVGVWDPKANVQDAQEFRRSQEALYGKAAGSMGHERRSRVDEGKLKSGGELLAGLDAWNEARGAGRPKGPPGAQGEGGDTKAGIPANKRYVKEEGFLDHLLGGLDYPGNIARSALSGVGSGKAWQYTKQAASKDRKTTSGDLKDQATEALGLGKLRMGKDDGNFQVGDVGDVAADLVVDVFTDPLTWLSGGWSRAAKSGGKIGKAAANASMAKIGEGALSDAGKTYIKAKTVGSGAIGAAYGAGSVDGDAPLTEKLAAGAVGAAVGAVAGPTLEKAGVGARKYFDKASDWYAVKTRGSAFADFANQRNIAIDAFEKKKNIAEWIRQGRLEALDGLDETGRLQASQIMQELKTETIKRRNLYQKQQGIKDGTKEFNQMMLKINEEVSQETLPIVLRQAEKPVADAVESFGKHNEAVMKKYNKEIFGIEDIAKETAEGTGKGVVGLRFHIDDVYKKKDLKEAAESLKASQLKKASSGVRSETGLARDASYAVYAEDMAGKFLNEMDKKAMSLMATYKGQMPISKIVRTGEKALGVLDPLTNFAKANMLYFSMSWLKNNFADNAGKAWIENGMPGLVGAVTTGNFQKNLSRDVMRLYKGNFDMAYKAEHFKDMLNLGVLDNPMYKSMADDITRDFLFRPQQLQNADPKTFAEYVKKGQDWWFDKNPVTKLVGNVGSYMEGTARAMTYVNTFEGLKKSKAFVGASEPALKRIAAKIVKETFFDYGDVTHFESAVFKRIVPFYSFYSKNVPYWMKATFDPERAGRVLALEKLRHNIGKDPTASDKQGMSPFLAEAAPRMMGKNARGEQVILLSPSSSQHDALKMLNPLDWPKQLLDKGSTIPKGLFELISGKDLFSGDDLYPSAENQQKKFLYSRGFKWIAIKKGLEALGADSDSIIQKVAGTAGVDVDKKGNPFTKSGWTVVLDKVGSTFLPHGFVDQVAGSVGKIGFSKETLDEAVFNRLSPMLKVKVGASQGRMVKLKKMMDEAKEKK